MGKRPTLAESLRASLSKGTHVETAEKIARGLQPIHDDEAPSPTQSVKVAPAVKPVPAKVPEVATVDGKTKEPAKQLINKRDIEPGIPASADATKQAAEQTINQSNNQTSSQTNKQAIDLAVEQTNNQSVQQLTAQSRNQSSKQSIAQTPEQSIEQSLQQTIEQSVEQTYKQSGKQSSRLAWLPLNETQGRILLFLYERGNGLTNMDIICYETGIAYGTARTAIDVLMKEGYVTSKTRHNGHAFRGFEYTLNNHLCSLYVARINGDQNSEQLPWQSIKQSNNHSSNQALGQANRQTVVSFSSRSDFNNKPTTTDNDDLFRDPELGYWREKGVTTKQVEKWAEEFVADVEMIIQSLKYCRYEMVVMNLEEEKPIDNPKNWFYRIMQRSGLYPRPADYKSMAEIRAEEMERSARDLAETRERLAAAEIDLEFQKIMDDLDGDMYKQLHAQLTDFEKQQKGKVLEMGLRRVFQASKEPTGS